MKIIKPSHKIKAMPDNDFLIEIIEYAARTCYNSVHLMKPGSAENFLPGLLKSKHETPFEHMTITVLFICDRGIMAELTRHRVASFSIQSTRYCNYSKDKFGSEITVIRPFFWKDDSQAYKDWLSAMEYCEKIYMKLINEGAKPEQARSVLPNSLKTEIVMTANMRAWRHVLNLRCSKPAHPQIRELMLPLLDDFNDELPVIFGDIWRKYNEKN